ncbi:MAG: GTP-binding protein [Brachybacterium sp.]
MFDTAVDDDPVDELPLARLLREDAHGHDDHEHARAVSVALPGPVCPSALIDLLEDPPPGAYRVKGRVSVLGPRADRGYVVNLVGHMIRIAPLPDPPPVGELVVIGVDLDQDAAQRWLGTIAAAPAERPDASGLRRLHRYRRLSD